MEGASTFADAGIRYLCNGDSMFHVNKGAIGFRMDGATGVTLVDTSVSGLWNLGAAGAPHCGDYGGGTSHPGASLTGYGGSAVRAYSFAGSADVSVRSASADRLTTLAGPVVGFDVLTDSFDVVITSSTVAASRAGGPVTDSTPLATAHSFHIGPDAGPVTIRASCASGLEGHDGAGEVEDQSGTVELIGTSRRC